MNSTFIDFSNQISTKTISYFFLDQKNMIIPDQIDYFKKSIAIPNQTHSINVKKIDKSGEYLNTDGLITDNPKIILSLKVADCVPIYLFDSCNKIIGLIHSGWRGLVNGIVSNTIYKMLESGSNLKYINIFLGPSICFNCYEVSSDVAENFHNNSKEEIENGKWKISLYKEIRTILINEGIFADKIKEASICTYESKYCHSYRRDGLKSGRMIALMGMKNEFV